MFTIGQQVSKVNVNGKVGSARVYEIATVTPLVDRDAFDQRYFAETATDGMLYTVRKVGGKGNGGCYYSVSELVPAV